MKRESIQVFKLLSRIEFENGFISLEEYCLRLVRLYQLTNESEEIKEYLFSIFGEFDIREFKCYNNDCYSHREKIYDEEVNQARYEQNNTEDSDLHFTTKKSGKNFKWKFIKGDSDFFPSIPHGHAATNDKIKLDSYLGYYYDTTHSKSKSNPIERETREYIINLWNDDKFRVHAIDQVDWYLKTYPKFTWRVSPEKIKKIPQKR